MKCKNCDTEITEDANYCDNCGKKISTIQNSMEFLQTGQKGNYITRTPTKGSIDHNLQDEKKDHRNTKLYWIIGVGTFILLAIILLLFLRLVKGYVWADWTGFGDFVNPIGEYHRAKTLWDWLELLIIPFVLAFLVYWFNRQERRYEIRIAEQRTQLERELTRDRSEESALQKYLTEMSEFLINGKLWDSSPNDEVRFIAQLKTVTLLRLLSKDRRNIVFQFIQDAGLGKFLMVRAKVRFLDLSGSRILGISFNNADLTGTIFKDSTLVAVDLSKANLAGSNFQNTYLTGVDFTEANLSKRSFVDIRLGKKNVSGPIKSKEDELLDGADFNGARFIAVDFTKANLVGVKLLKTKRAGVIFEECIMPDGETFDSKLHLEYLDKDSNYAYSILNED